MHPSPVVPLLAGLLVMLFPCFIIGLFFVVGICGTILWVIAIIDCAKNESPVGNDKLVWLLIIIFLHAIGAAIYFLVRRPQRIRELGR
jgi:hypothetical protein